VIICLPRPYMGFHYPSDLVAGAAIGLGTAALARISSLRDAVGEVPEHWQERSAESFCSCFFILTFQIATIFESARESTLLLPAHQAA
jgi:hypothetical protein